MGMEQMDVDLQNMFEKIMPRDAKSREVTVRQSRQILLEHEIESLMDREALSEQAVKLAEESGIIFLDELDKICGHSSSHGPDVSRQGVQRDLLPVVEGTTVQTRYGSVRTEHVLFIAAGAFHTSKPSDLMPELQGRFPIRVELTDLGKEDFVRILQEPRHSLIRQYTELLATEGLVVEFTESAILALAEMAHHVNKTTQNIGARRLQTMLEKLLEQPSFDAPDRPDKRLLIDEAYVQAHLGPITSDEDLSRYIL
jgi:ATP-dependent HslUV protease ATP-binding subunit HslU